MLIKLEARRETSRAMAMLTPILAVVLTVFGGAGLFAFLGFSPLAALHAFFIAPLTDLYGFTELLLKAAPLAVMGVGLSIGFRANVWNIGAEGQFTLGAIAGGGIALWAYDYWPDAPQFLLIPMMMLAGVAGGMAWAAIPAFLKTRFNANEILTSLMLTYVATLFLSLLVHGAWRDPDGFNFPESRLFQDAALLPIIVEETRLNLSTILSLFVVVACWVLLARTFIGFQVKVVGMAPKAAAYAGFSEKKLVWFCLLLSGALAGFSGVSEVSGPIGQLLPSISPGYGFTAIIVAFLGRLHPVGILLAAMLMALTYIGGEAAQITLGLPLAVTGVFQGMILFFLLATDVLIQYRVRFVSPRAGH